MSTANDPRHPGPDPVDDFAEQVALAMVDALTANGRRQVQAATFEAACHELTAYSVSAGPVPNDPKGQQS
jgi:hypothetical protein